MLTGFMASARLRQGEADHLGVADWQQIALAEDPEDALEGRILIVRPPMRGIADAGRFGAVRGAEWDRPGRRGDGAVFTVETFARYFVHDPVHHLYDVTGRRYA